MIRQSDSTREKPVRLARRAIDMLEQRIFDEFGLRVTIGAEQEFTVQTHSHTDHNGMLISNPLNLPGQEVKGDYTPQAARDTTPKGDYTPQVARADQQGKDRLFPDSPYVAYSYREQAVDYGHFQYETVLSHHAFNREENDGQLHMRGNHLARAIEGLRNILKAPPERLPKTGPFAHAENLHELVKRVSLWPSICEGRITNGLHICVGLEDPKTGAPLFTEGSTLLKPVREAMEDMNLEGGHLLGDDDATLARHEVRNEHTMVFPPPNKNYIENKVAAANANPYYAILNTMAGLYAGLKRAQQNAPDLYKSRRLTQLVREGSATHAHLCGQTFNSRSHLVAEDNGLRALLNDLEKGLGDQLVEAVAHTPPGKELLPIQGRSNGRSY